MGHIIDSEFYSDNWGTSEMRAVFDDRRRFQRWLDIEAVLAGVQAELGVIPADAADEIKRNASIDLLDAEEIRSGIARSALESERVERPRIFWTNLPSAAVTAGSATVCGPVERPRVSGFFSGASARTI